jgi:hypothetical protein
MSTRATWPSFGLILYSMIVLYASSVFGRSDLLAIQRSASSPNVRRDRGASLVLQVDCGLELGPALVEVDTINRDRDDVT